MLTSEKQANWCYRKTSFGWRDFFPFSAYDRSNEFSVSLGDCLYEERAPSISRIEELRVCAMLARRDPMKADNLQGQL